MDVLQRIEKMIIKNTFKQRKKKPRLKIKHELALIGFRKTRPWSELSARTRTRPTDMKRFVIVVLVGVVLISSNIFLLLCAVPANVFSYENGD